MDTFSRALSSWPWRVAAVAAIVVALAGLMALPAAADAPIEFSETETFLALNPCTEEIHRVTITVDGRLHEHGDRQVEHYRHSGFTDDGYVLKGVESFVFNGNAERGVFNDIWRRADGSAFKVQGRFVATEDEVVVDDFTIRCIKR